MIKMQYCTNDGVCNYCAFEPTILTLLRNTREVDSDGDEIPDEGHKLEGYRVWYTVEVNIEPAPAEKHLQIACACQVCDLISSKLS